MNEAVMAPEIEAPVTSRRERLLRALRCEPVDHAPVWMMRQAGRALPEYRKLKERYTFLQLAQTPELAAEVTLQPIRRFGFDAAIIFSDILVIPEAMGVGYKFRETGGVEMDFTIRTAADIERLSVERVVEKLQYVLEAIRLTRKELGQKTGLLGFAGSPWTLANFMLDGGSARNTPAPCACSVKIAEPSKRFAKNSPRQSLDFCWRRSMRAWTPCKSSTAMAACFRRSISLRLRPSGCARLSAPWREAFR
jgi:uroporphyrinogen-III decarboxylase